MYLHTKFQFSGFSRLGCVFFDVLLLSAVLNTRWRLFQNVGIFSLPNYYPPPMPNFLFLVNSEHPEQYDE